MMRVLVNASLADCSIGGKAAHHMRMLRFVKNANVVDLEVEESVQAVECRSTMDAKAGEWQDVVSRRW